MMAFLRKTSISVSEVEQLKPRCYIRIALHFAHTQSASHCLAFCTFPGVPVRYGAKPDAHRTWCDCDCDACIYRYRTGTEYISLQVDYVDGTSRHKNEAPVDTVWLKKT